MTQEEKELLLKDLCARLPYGVQITNENGKLHIPFIGVDAFISDNILIHGAIQDVGFHLCKNIEYIRPYLRPMSSMTEEEQYEYNTAIDNDIEPERIVDWYNLNHFDYRGLIEKGLALEAPEGMYETEI